MQYHRSTILCCTTLAKSLLPFMVPSAGGPNQAKEGWSNIISLISHFTIWKSWQHLNKLVNPRKLNSPPKLETEDPTNIEAVKSALPTPNSEVLFWRKSTVLYILKSTKQKQLNVLESKALNSPAHHQILNTKSKLLNSKFKKVNPAKQDL